MSLFRSRAVDFDEKWAGLRETIGRVVRLQTVEMAKWNDHYSDIYALCEAFPTPFADRLYSETEAYLDSLVHEICQHLAILDRYEPHSMLASYQKHWLRYQQGAKFLHNLFSYFNRVSLRKYKSAEVDSSLEAILGQQKTTPATTAQSPLEIRHMCLCVWRRGVLSKISSPLIKAALKEIQRDRDGESVDLAMVRDVVFSLIEVEEYNKESSLRYYQRVFEGPFLEETKQHYLHVASKLVSELEVSEYMQEVVATLQTARRRGQRFLHQTSITKFIRECEARLVEDYLSDYLYSTVHLMVQQERRRDLKNMFYLLNGIPGALDVLLTEFEQCIRSQGLAALSPLNNDKTGSGGVVEFMTAVMGIHSHYHQLITELFSSHKHFYSALDRACRVFVNAHEKHRQHPRAPMLLARYCDQLLRKSSKAVGERDIEDKLEEVITVFRYIDDKDVFQKFYSRMLSRRLMQGLSISMEMEENMIQRLKHACGFEYVARLQRMVVDVKLSEDCVTSFQEHLGPAQLPITFTTLVLQSAAWPFSKPTDNFTVPPQMLSVINQFESFYETKYTGRKLSWLYHMSIGDLRLTYLKRPYTVSATTHQMAILLAFNTAEQLSFSSLLQHTGLDNQEMTYTLQSLIDSKLLSLEDGETSVHSQECVVCLNKNYSNKRTKFKITASLQRDTQQEVEQTQTAVTEDRKLHIQAAIVRVMKARKSLKHNRLIEETIQQVRTRFTPSIPMIKRCIETLMERQYLERQETAKDTYDYIA